MEAFAYLIIEKKSGKWYYGVRYAKGCHPNDMLKTYFTSSFPLHDMIKMNPQDFHCEIRREFDDVDKALRWEHRVLERMKVLSRGD